MMSLEDKMRFEPEDFIVEELPLYEPKGEGTHTYFAIRKRGLTTFKAIKELADTLQVNQRDIGYAGLKDKHAITTQVLSVEGITPEKVLKIEHPSIQVLWAERHQHKLRVGHLKGNRFAITLRNVSSDFFPIISKRIEHLAKEGVHNWFGPQRFGNQKDTHLMGKALVKGNWEEVLDYISTNETAQSFKLPQRLDELKAIRFIPHRLRKFYLSAYQAYLFNRILERRLPEISRLWNGDIVVKLSNGAPYVVKDASVEQPRSDEFEISPTGPIFGYKMRQPSGIIQEMEKQLLAEEDVRFEAFRKVAGIRLTGTRRPLRMRMEFHQIQFVDDELRLCFSLPAGGYATVVLDELFKHDALAGSNNRNN